MRQLSQSVQNVPYIGIFWVPYLGTFWVQYYQVFNVNSAYKLFISMQYQIVVAQYLVLHIYESFIRHKGSTNREENKSN